MMYQGTTKLKQRSYKQIIASLTLVVMVLVGLWLLTLRALVVYTDNQDNAGVTHIVMEDNYGNAK